MIFLWDLMLYALKSGTCTRNSGDTKGILEGCPSRICLSFWQAMLYLYNLAKV